MLEVDIDIEVLLEFENVEIECILPLVALLVKFEEALLESMLLLDIDLLADTLLDVDRLTGTLLDVVVFALVDTGFREIVSERLLEEML